MKVKLLKDHLGDKKGKKIEVSKERGNYFIRCGVAEEVKGSNTDKKTTNEPRA